MEGLTKRTYIFAGIMLVAGLLNMGTVIRSVRPNKDEKWMEARAPETVNGVGYIKSSQNPAQSYKMNDITYRTLNPFGIVAREYTTKEGRTFDVVLIASESRASFHDPRICFSGSGWSIVDQKTEKVQTKSRGIVPFTLVTMQNSTIPSQKAAFFYRGPTGFLATTLNVKWDMFVQRLLGSPDVEGVFYRFIPQYPNASTEDLKAFIAEYLEASKESSQGYF